MIVTCPFCSGAFSLGETAHPCAGAVSVPAVPQPGEDADSLDDRLARFIAARANEAMAPVRALLLLVEQFTTKPGQGDR